MNDVTIERRVDALAAREGDVDVHAPWTSKLAANGTVHAATSRMVRASIAIVLLGCGTEAATPSHADAATDSTTGADAACAIDTGSAPVEVGPDAANDVAPVCEPARPLEDVGGELPCGPSGSCPSKTLTCVGGQCVSYGTIGARCMFCVDGTTRWCAPGLSCENNLCGFTLPSGAACANDPIARCPSGETCLLRDGYLRCGRIASLTVGSACQPESYSERCVEGASCVDDGSRRTCRRLGALGGVCRDHGMPCDEGECHWLTPWSSTCAALVRDGASCDPYGRTSLCRGGSTCAPSATDFVCLPNGSAPGGPCLSEPLSCLSPLTCVSGHCMRDVAGACEPRVPSDRCPSGRVCAASDPDRGRCVAPVPRTLDGHLVSPPVAVALSASASTCVAFDVPCGASLYAEVNDGMGTRFAWSLSLSDASGRQLVPFSYANNLLTAPLQEGRYTLCAPVGMLDRTQYLNVALQTGGKS
jgi:hypothetical protein